MKKKIILLSSALVITLALQFTSEDSHQTEQVADVNSDVTIQMNYDPDGFGGLG